MKSTLKRIIFLPAAFIVLSLLLASQAVRAEVAFDGVKPAVIIDVRTPAEYAEGHIIGAINIPVDRIGQDIHSIQGIDKSSPILLYCRTSRRSELARRILAEQGFTKTINGGTLSDVARKLPSCSYPNC